MKKLIAILSVSGLLLAVSCGDGKAKEEAAAKAEILQLEQMDAEIDSVTQEIEAKEDSLEAALEDL